MTGDDPTVRSVSTGTPSDAELPEELRALAAAIRTSAFLALGGGADPAAVATLLLSIAESVRVHPRTDVRPEAVSSIHAAGDLTERWCSDREFLDDRGRPKPLPLKGRKGSFSALVKRTRGFSSVTEALAVLERHKAAELNANVVHLLSRAIIATGMTPEARARAWMSAVGLLTTLETNLSNRPRFEKMPERCVVNQRFPVSALPSLRLAVEEHGDRLLLDLEQFMKQYEELAAERSEPTVPIGVGYWEFRVPMLQEPPGKPARRTARRGKGR